MFLIVLDTENAENAENAELKLLIIFNTIIYDAKRFLKNFLTESELRFHFFKN
jgi:hypothetical protein